MLPNSVQMPPVNIFPDYLKKEEFKREQCKLNNCSRNSCSAWSYMSLELSQPVSSLEPRPLLYFFNVYFPHWPVKLGFCCFFAA